MEEQEKVRLPSIDALSRAVLMIVRAGRVVSLPEIIAKLPDRFAESRTGDVHARVLLLVDGGYLDADAGGRQVVYTVACTGQNGRYIRTNERPGQVVGQATTDDLARLALLVRGAQLFHTARVEL